MYCGAASISSIKYCKVLKISRKGEIGHYNVQIFEIQYVQNLGLHTLFFDRNLKYNHNIQIKLQAKSKRMGK